VADSRRLGDEIHPWPPNGDFRPRADLYVHALDVELINEIKLQTASQFCIVVTE
jgi:hypothetical protein